MLYDYLARVSLFALLSTLFFIELPYYEPAYFREAAHALAMLALLCFVPAFWDAFFPTVRTGDESTDPEPAAPPAARLPFFDVVRGAAIIAVVLVHVLYVYLSRHVANDTDFLQFFIFLRFAIPVFIVCSGALLDPLKARRSLLAFYKSKIVRILIPYAIFTAFAAAYASYDGGLSFLGSFFEMFFTATGMQPYYFIAVLLQLYLLYPLIVRFRDSREFLLGSFAFSLACFLAPDAWIGGTIPGAFFGQYFFFFVYGMHYRRELLSAAPRKEHVASWAFLALFYPVIYLLFPGFYMNSTIFFGIVVFRLAHAAFHAPRLQGMRNAAVLGLLRRYGEVSLWIFLAHFPLSFVAYDLAVRVMRLEYHIGVIAACLMAVIASYPLALAARAAYGALLGLVFGTIRLVRGGKRRA